MDIISNELVDGFNMWVCLGGSPQICGNEITW